MPRKSLNATENGDFPAGAARVRPRAGLKRIFADGKTPRDEKGATGALWENRNKHRCGVQLLGCRPDFEPMTFFGLYGRRKPQRYLRHRVPLISQFDTGRIKSMTQEPDELVSSGKQWCTATTVLG